ncbi:hypothetical protein C9Z16_23760, partial [Escherichia coli]
MSRLRVFRQTGWFIAGLMTGLPATAAPAEASSMACNVAVASGGVVVANTAVARIRLSAVD